MLRSLEFTWKITPVSGTRRLSPKEKPTFGKRNFRQIRRPRRFKRSTLNRYFGPLQENIPCSAHCFLFPYARTDKKNTLLNLTYTEFTY
jgi:hypothetical protein